jgi:hypothetical protein
LIGGELLEEKAMTDERDWPRPGEQRGKKPKTKSMPQETLPDLTEWTKRQRKPAPEDKGEAPPEPPQDTPEPREHGTIEGDMG